MAGTTSSGPKTVRLPSSISAVSGGCWGDRSPGFYSSASRESNRTLHVTGKSPDRRQRTKIHSVGPFDGEYAAVRRPMETPLVALGSSGRELPDGGRYSPEGGRQRLPLVWEDERTQIGERGRRKVLGKKERKKKKTWERKKK